MKEIDPKKEQKTAPRGRRIGKHKTWSRREGDTKREGSLAGKI